MSMIENVGSVSGRVEVGSTFGHSGLTIVLVHLWEGVAILVELARGLLPPHGEVLLQGATQVGSMGSWLGHNLVERLAGALPVLTLHG